jgi:phytoene/squalene synthetase
MKFEADRAWQYYREGVRLQELISADSRAALWTLIQIYAGILKKIESIHYDVLARPHPRLSTIEKAWIMLRGGTGLFSAKAITPDR